MRKFIVIFCIFLLTGCTKNPTVRYSLTTRTPAPMNKNIDVALVLSGGGARALAHLGVIKVLEENNIPIDLIVGSSGGSLVGALYADKKNADEVKSLLINTRRADLIDFSIFSAISSTYSLKGSINGKLIEQFLENNLQSHEFQDLKIPFIAVATDVVTGDTIGLRSGPIAPAVRASTAIPGLFSPVHLYDMTLVDGSVSAPIPIRVAQKYNPRVIIAVNVSAPPPKAPVKNMFELMFKSLDITHYELNKSMVTLADIIIEPEVSTISLFDDDKNEELFEAGMVAAKENLNDILNKTVKRRKLFDLFFKAGERINKKEKEAAVKLQ